MRSRTKTRALAAIIAAVSLIGAAPPPVLAAPPCAFVLGFKALHDALPDVIGMCVDDESYNATGDSVQHTTGGLLAWRRADNWTAFTDGFRTWVNGPNGIQERLNSQRFPWEAGQAVSGTTSASTVSSSRSTSIGSSSTTITQQCSAQARSGDVSAVGLNATTVITGSGPGDTTVVQNHSSSSSTPGVTTTAC